MAEVDTINVIRSIFIRICCLLIDEELDKTVIYSYCSIKEVKYLNTIYHDFFNEGERSYEEFAKICNDVLKISYKYIVIHTSKKTLIVN